MLLTEQMLVLISCHTKAHGGNNCTINPHSSSWYVEWKTWEWHCTDVETPIWVVFTFWCLQRWEFTGRQVYLGEWTKHFYKVLVGELIAQKRSGLLIGLATVLISIIWWSIPDASESREVDDKVSIRLHSKKNVQLH